MKYWKSTLIALMASAMGASTSLHASTYAVSTASIDNFTVTGGTVSGWTFSQNIAINGTTTLANGDGLNAPASCIGCSYDDDFVAHGTGVSYTYSDSLISSTALNSLGGGSASAISEIYSGNGISGSAMSSNSMSGMLDVTTTGIVSFNYDVNYYLDVFSTNSDTGLASFSFDLGLYEFGSGVNLLDTDASASMFFGINQTSNLVSALTSGVIDINLAAGLYSLDINMTQNAATTVSAVPVPAAIWLFASGFLGLVAVARSKKA